MKNARILVIEDHEAISAIAKSALMFLSREDGYEYEVTLAHDGIQGLKLTWKLHPDVIVLDLQMPRLDGYGVLELLRFAGDTTPVIIMTATPREEDQVNGFLLGYDAYITKPFSAKLLYHHVKNQLQNRPKPGTKQNIPSYL